MRYQHALSLFLIGILSGIATLFFMTNKHFAFGDGIGSLYVTPGVVFGIFLTSYLFYHLKRKVSLFFVPVSIAAYVLAVFVNLSINDPISSMDRPLGWMLAGIAGAVVLGAFCCYLMRASVKEWAAYLAVFVVVGGIASQAVFLGTVGALLFLFVIWQSCVAATIGLLLDRSVGEQPKTLFKRS